MRHFLFAVASGFRFFFLLHPHCKIFFAALTPQLFLCVVVKGTLGTITVTLPTTGDDVTGVTATYRFVVNLRQTLRQNDYFRFDLHPGTTFTGTPTMSSPSSTFDSCTTSTAGTNPWVMCRALTATADLTAITIDVGGVINPFSALASASAGFVAEVRDSTGTTLRDTRTGYTIPGFAAGSFGATRTFLSTDTTAGVATTMTLSLTLRMAVVSGDKLVIDFNTAPYTFSGGLTSSSPFNSCAYDSGSKLLTCTADSAVGAASLLSFTISAGILNPGVPAAAASLPVQLQAVTSLLLRDTGSLTTSAIVKGLLVAATYNAPTSAITGETTTYTISVTPRQSFLQNEFLVFHFNKGTTFTTATPVPTSSDGSVFAGCAVSVITGDIVEVKCQKTSAGASAANTAFTITFANNVINPTSERTVTATTMRHESSGSVVRDDRSTSTVTITAGTFTTTPSLVPSPNVSGATAAYTVTLQLRNLIKLGDILRFDFPSSSDTTFDADPTVTGFSTTGGTGSFASPCARDAALKRITCTAAADFGGTTPTLTFTLNSIINPAARAATTMTITLLDSDLKVRDQTTSANLGEIVPDAITAASLNNAVAAEAKTWTLGAYSIGFTLKQAAHLNDYLRFTFAPQTTFDANPVVSGNPANSGFATCTTSGGGTATPQATCKITTLTGGALASTGGVITLTLSNIRNPRTGTIRRLTAASTVLPSSFVPLIYFGLSVMLHHIVSFSHPISLSFFREIVHGGYSNLDVELLYSDGSSVRSRTDPAGAAPTATTGAITAGAFGGDVTVTVGTAVTSTATTHTLAIPVRQTPAISDKLEVTFPSRVVCAAPTAVDPGTSSTAELSCNLGGNSYTVVCQLTNGAFVVAASQFQLRVSGCTTSPIEQAATSACGLRLTDSALTSKDVTSLTTTKMNYPLIAAGSLATSTFTPASTTSGDTTTYTIAVPFRQKGIGGVDSMVFVFPEETYFDTLSINNGLGGCVATQATLTVTCNVITDVLVGAQTFALDGVINPPERSSLSTLKVYLREGAVDKDKTEAATTPAISPGTMTSAYLRNLNPAEARTMVTATYAVTLRLGQLARSGDVFEFTFYPGTSFATAAGSEPSASVTSAGGATMTNPCTSPSATVLRCTVNAPGTSFGNLALVEMEITGIGNPSLQHSGDSVRLVRHLIVSPSLRVKATLSTGTTDAILPYAPVVTLTPAVLAFSTATTMKIAWATHQGFATTDKLFFALPEYTQLVANPVITHNSAGPVTFTAASANSGLINPTLTITVASGSHASNTPIEFTFAITTSRYGYIDQSALEAKLTNSANVNKDRTTAATSVGIYGGGLGRGIITRADQKTGTINTYDFSIVLLRGMTVNQCIRASLPVRTRFTGSGVATATGASATNGVQFGACSFTNSDGTATFGMVSCPVTASTVPAAIASGATMTYRITEIQNAYHPTHAASNAITFDVMPAGSCAAGAAVWTGSIGEIQATTTGSLGAVSVTHSNSLAGATADFSVSIAFRHFLRSNYKLQLVMDPGTTFSTNTKAEFALANYGTFTDPCTFGATSGTNAPTLVCTLNTAGPHTFVMDETLTIILRNVEHPKLYHNAVTNWVVTLRDGSDSDSLVDTMTSGSNAATVPVDCSGASVNFQRAQHTGTVDTVPSLKSPLVYGPVKTTTNFNELSIARFNGIDKFLSVSTMVCHTGRVFVNHVRTFCVVGVRFGPPTIAPYRSVC